jgi:hypothetical protein
MPVRNTRKTTGTETRAEGNRSSGGDQTGEEYMNAWMSFAKEMGDTATDFVKRFGEEQQKNYEKWVATVQDGANSQVSPEDIKEVGERFKQWTSFAQEMGQRVKDSFTPSSNLQKDFLDAWNHVAQSGASPEDAAKVFSELAQKFWTGIAGNLYEKSLASLRPELKLDEFIKSQEEPLREFSENFRRLTLSYFTSPPFVSPFGRTLDSTLEMQKLASENYWASVRLVTDLAQETTAYIQKVYKSVPPWGQAPK